MVRGHDNDHILEVNSISKTIRKMSIFKDLQQNVKDIRMCFLYFVEQHDRVGRTLDALGKLTALLVADLARRRANQL